MESGATLIGKGIYSISEAARLVKVHHNTVRAWCRSSERVLQPEGGEYGGRQSLNFLDLIDLRAVAVMRANGIPLKEIRRVHKRMRWSLHIEHPFATTHLKRLAKELWLDDEAASELSVKVPQIVPKAQAVNTGQLGIPEIIDDLLDDIEWSDDGVAKIWRPAKLVVIDPQRCFGAPIIDEARIPTEILSNQYFANEENADLVARIWNVRTEAVHAAVSFERSLAS